MKLYSARKLVKSQLRQKYGIDFIRYPLYRILHDNEISLILDVGANRGQFVLDVYAAGYRGAITSFELIPSVFSELERNAQKHPQWRVVNSALGRNKGMQNHYCPGKV